MDIGIGLLIGVLLGGGVSFFLIRTLFQNRLKEANNKADITLKEAELTAKRKINEAENAAEKIVSRAEQNNEAIKQKKIQESRDNFSKLKSEYETWKAEQKVELKEKELTIAAQEKELQQKYDALSTITEQLDSN